MVSWTVSVVSTASRKTRLAFWTMSRFSVLRVRFGILQAWHGWLDPVKVPEFQIDPLPNFRQTAPEIHVSPRFAAYSRLTFPKRVKHPGRTRTHPLWY